MLGSGTLSQTEAKGNKKFEFFLMLKKTEVNVWKLSVLDVSKSNELFSM